ncbi:hypothetical protein DHEL01_v204158 [Diaporthe helianthi]|uniref:Uncharacterized protein n=1 Tax=Diaporthe helianthi TaxID=158607 RepID=A0A2P5I4M9_DIAHE|nr:hypothetical protein DHEL01_v204158 [Diaporthe helianthi]
MTILVTLYSVAVCVLSAPDIQKLQDLRALAATHEPASALCTLIEEDGAGAWPPRTDHDNWPLALRPYKSVYLELAPLLSAATPSLDDATNRQRRHDYRSLMRKLLSQRICTSQVEAVMAAVEAGNWDLFARDAYNGFYSCIALLRHAYRWALIPVVKVAQEELTVDLPLELDIPWLYLQRTFGVEADVGNHTSNVLLNFDKRRERIFKVNVTLNEEIQRAEDSFFWLFYDVEVQSCLESVKCVASDLRRLLMTFYENLHDSNIPRKFWLSYVQGFHGWGAGRMIDGKFVKYDGLSGNHILIFQAIDAFLGLEPYLTDEDMYRYVPVNQRNLCRSLKKHCIREMLGQGTEDRAIADEFSKIIHQMRVRIKPQEPLPKSYNRKIKLMDS